MGAYSGHYQYLYLAQSLVSHKSAPREGYGDWVCVVVLLSRFDFVRLDKKCFDNFIKSPSQVLLLLSTCLIFLALVVTLSVAAIDERIELYPDQPSLW